MNIIMLSRDPQVFMPGTPAALRMDRYRALVAKLYVLVFDARRGVIRSFWDLYHAALLAVKESQASSEPTILTAQDPFEVGMVGMRVASRFHVPLEVQVHTDLFSPLFARESLKNKMRVYMARRVLVRAHSIRVVSKRIKDSLLRELPEISEERIHVQPIVVDVSLYSKKEDTFHSSIQSRTFVAVSRLSREKNLSLLLSAFRDVVREVPFARLEIVGDGPERRMLEEEARTYAFGDRVVFLGNKTQEELRDIYAHADCYVLTSNYEGYGRTVVEAMASGLPVIMTDVGIAGDIVRDNVNGFIVPVGDERTLSLRMIWVAENESVRTSVGNAAYETVHAMEHDEDIYAKAIVSLWQQMIV